MSSSRRSRGPSAFAQAQRERLVAARPTASSAARAASAAAAAAAAAARPATPTLGDLGGAHSRENRGSARGKARREGGAPALGRVSARVHAAAAGTPLPGASSATQQRLESYMAGGAGAARLAGRALGRARSAPGAPRRRPAPPPHAGAHGAGFQGRHGDAAVALGGVRGRAAALRPLSAGAGGSHAAPLQTVLNAERVLAQARPRASRTQLRAAIAELQEVQAALAAQAGRVQQAPPRPPSSAASEASLRAQLEELVARELKRLAHKGGKGGAVTAQAVGQQGGGVDGGGAMRGGAPPADATSGEGARASAADRLAQEAEALREATGLDWDAVLNDVAAAVARAVRLSRTINGGRLSPTSLSKAWVVAG